MKPPAVTVLMTVYNAGRFLDPSLTSIADQSFRDWECVVVDDASTDGSRDVVTGWVARDSRFRLIPNDTNKGQTPCLNQGLREARGQWIARQDADDLSLPERLERQLAEAGNRALLGTNGWIIDENDHVIGLLDAPLGHDSITWTSPFLNPFMHTAVLARTAVIRDELGGYDESFRIAQDYDLWTRLIARHPSANLPDRLVSYRHLTSSLSKAGSGTAFAEARRVSDREAPRVFGRSLTAREADLLAAFREGLTAQDRTEFWALYQSLQSVQSPSGDHRRSAALHHLKVAGAVGSFPVLLSEIAAAMGCDPGTTLHWLADRLAAGLRRG